MDLDNKYEFQAPKYVDFTQLNDTYDVSDKWFDEREGDEGGISIDMVPFYENAIGFNNATTAISAALKSNSTVELQVPVDIPNPNNKSQMRVYCDHEKKTSIDKDERKGDARSIDMVPSSENVIGSNYAPSNGTIELQPPVDIPNPDNKSQMSVDSDHEKRTSIDKGENEGDGCMVKSDENSIGLSNTSAALELNKTIELQVHKDIPHADNSPQMNVHSAHEKRTSIDKAVQFTTPKIAKKIIDQQRPRTRSCSRNTPKSRFQPIRKSTSTLIDYADHRKRKSTTEEETHSKKARISQPRSSTKVALEIMRTLQQQTRAHRQLNERNMKKALKGQRFAPVRSTNITITKEFDFALSNRAKEHSMCTRSEKRVEKPFEKNLRQESMLSQNYKNQPTKPVPFNFVLPEKMKSTNQNWESMAEAAHKYQHRTPTRFRQKQSEEELRNKPFKPKVTKPVTPQLLTRNRGRNVVIESAKDLEEKIVEEMKSYQFKATEVNPRIMEKKGMYGVKHVPPSSNTEQKPFSFKIEQRIGQRKSETDHEDDGSDCDKAKKSEKLKPTRVQPFSFSERDKERYLKKDEKIKNQMEEESKLHEFHASMLPSFSPEILPEVTTKVPTIPIPFKISEGSQSYQSKHEQKLKKEAEDEITKRHFKAQNNRVTSQEPFQPMKGLIPPTRIADFKLNTEIRAYARAEYDEGKKEKEKKDEEERLKLEKQREIEEEEAIKQMRKDAVHKANPVRIFKPVEIKKSTIPLTEAKTPNLEVRKRAVLRDRQKLNKQVECDK